MNAVDTLPDQIRGFESLASRRLGGLAVSSRLLEGPVPVLEVTVEGREEFPVYVTCSDTQILCICYLWDEAEVRPDRRLELMESLLDLNVSVPLSAFGRIGSRYVLFGALSRDAEAADVAADVAMLSANALDALDALADYLH